MPAVVLDHEQAHQKPRRRHGNCQAQQIAPLQAEPHQHPKPNEWDGGDHDLDQTAELAWLPVAVESWQQIAGSY
jgi:hypothetical protein